MKFAWIIKYAGILKYIPPLPQLFDLLMLIWSYFFKKHIINSIDKIENELTSWPNIVQKIHKYGGMQFNIGNKELGHIHGNGLVDIQLNLELKNIFIEKSFALPHHIFKNSGCVSFWLKNENDYRNAIELFRAAYEMRLKKNVNFR